MTLTPELVLNFRAALGEGPAWDPQTHNLYWVNIHAGHLHIFDPKDGSDHLIDIGEFLGCAAPRENGGVVLGLRSGFATLDLSTERLTRLVNPEPHSPEHRFNDGKCDPAGRFLAGTMNDTETKASGSLYSLAPDGTLRTLVTGVQISNGLTWSPDYRTFYYIDTPTRMVMAYDYDLATGEIANPRPIVTVPPEMGWPDGMTSDTEGMLWVAIWGGAKLTRWNPATGQLLEQIPFPALNVSSCCFGGPDLTDIYVTTARKGMDAKELSDYPLSGGLFQIKTNIQGMPTFSFSG
ncbi:MAG: SMP-30/gluconolactonase/LRE family protein [Chloroflexota bacterium]